MMTKKEAQRVEKLRRQSQLGKDIKQSDSVFLFGLIDRLSLKIATIREILKDTKVRFGDCSKCNEYV